MPLPVLRNSWFNTTINRHSSHMNLLTIAMSLSWPIATVTRGGNGYKSTRFSLLRPIPTKEKFPHRVTHLVSRVEVSPQTQTRWVTKTYRVIHLNFLIACYNKKIVISNINYEICNMQHNSLLQSVSKEVKSHMTLNT
jgi:hypothetical protein